MSRDSMDVIGVSRPACMAMTEPEPETSGRRGPSLRVLACTFDCYGTLIDWQKGIEESLGALLRNAGLGRSSPVFPVYDEAERALEGRYAPYRDILAAAAIQTSRRLGVPLPEGAAKGFAGSLPSWPAFPDTVDVLRELGRRGIRRFILSNVDRDLLLETVRRNSLEVDGVVTAEDVRSYKPAPAHWERFFDQTSLERSTVLHVAQSLFHDIAPASKLGLRTVWVNRYDLESPPAPRPTFTVRDLHGLLSLLGP